MFKMKLKKLILKNNNQGDEALKHVFTTLISNKEMAIDIDLPL